jgi:hypothetical protein
LSEALAHATVLAAYGRQFWLRLDGDDENGGGGERSAVTRGRRGDVGNEGLVRGDRLPPQPIRVAAAVEEASAHDGFADAALECCGRNVRRAAEHGERRQWLHEQTVGSTGCISRGVGDEHRVGRVAALRERPTHGSAERTGHSDVGDEQPDHDAAD